MPNPLLRRKCALVAKVETTRGTAESLIASDGAYNVYDVQVTPNTEYIRRLKQGGSGKLAGVRGPKIVDISFWTDLVGKGSTGAVPLWADTFLPMCGFNKTSSTFTRVLSTASQKSGTLAHWKDGIQQLIAGATGNFTVTGGNGRPGRINFKLTGKLMSEGDVSQLDPTEPTILPPCGYDTFSIGASDVNGPEFTLDAGCSPYLLEDKNDASKTGFSHGIITEFNPTLACEPYAVATATKDWMADFESSVEAALSLIIGTEANNVVTIAASKLQLNAPPSFGDRGSALTRPLTFDINDDNGFTIAFT